MLVYPRAVGPEEDWNLGFYVNSIRQAARAPLSCCASSKLPFATASVALPLILVFADGPANQRA